jgi:hypothetical protein
MEAEIRLRPDGPMVTILQDDRGQVLNITGTAAQLLALAEDIEQRVAYDDQDWCYRCDREKKDCACEISDCEVPLVTEDDTERSRR